MIYGTPSAALVWVNIVLIDTSIMHRVAGGWTTVYDIGIVWTTLYLAAYYAILGNGWYALYHWGVQTPYKREKKQVRIFLVTSIISMTLCLGLRQHSPLRGSGSLPPFAPVITLVWMFGLWYAMHTYGMMKIDTAFAASEIINSMNDLLFLTDREGVIRQTNLHSCRILGMETADITGKTVDSFLRHRVNPSRMPCAFSGNRPRDHSSIEVDLMPLNGNDIPVRFSISVLRDREGDILGIVFVGYDLRENPETPNHAYPDADRDGYGRPGSDPAVPYHVADGRDVGYRHCLQAPVSRSPATSTIFTNPAARCRAWRSSMSQATVCLQASSR